MTPRRTSPRRTPSGAARRTTRITTKAVSKASATPVRRTPQRRRRAWGTLGLFVVGTAAAVGIVMTAQAHGVFAEGSMLTSFLSSPAKATSSAASSSRRSAQKLPRRVLRWLPQWSNGRGMPSSVSAAQQRRQERLRQSGQQAAAVSSHSLPPAPAPALPNPYRQMGIYITASSAADDDFLTTTFDAMTRVGATTFVVDVKGTTVYYHSQAPFATSIDIVRPVYELPEILRRAKEHGFYTIARYIAIKDQLFTDLAPETQLRHKDKGYPVQLGWVDPAHPTAQLYNSELLCELAAHADLDEINLDYIRLSSVMPYSTGYTGDEKAERLVNFIKMARDTIDRCGPKTRLGVSTYAILGWRFMENRETIGQDVVQYAPYVDVISPMAYPATFTSPAYYTPGKDPVSRDYWLVYRTLTGYRSLVGPEQEHKIRPWIQAYSVSTKNVVDQMNAVVDAGFCGFTFWNANNNYGPVLKAFEQWKQPERCLGDTVSVAEPKLGLLL